MGFDEIFDHTAEVYFYLYTIGDALVLIARTAMPISPWLGKTLCQPMDPCCCYFTWVLNRGRESTRKCLRTTSALEGANKQKYASSDIRLQ